METTSRSFLHSVNDSQSRTQYGQPLTIEDSNLVPSAPDPPQPRTELHESKSVRFSTASPPTTPPPIARTTRTFSLKSIEEGEYMDSFGPQYSRIFRNSREDAEFYSNHEGRGEEKIQGNSTMPILSFVGGLLFASFAAFLACLPLCSWTVRDHREERKRRYYVVGFLVGLCFFVGWMAALVHSIKRMERENGGNN